MLHDISLLGEVGDGILLQGDALDIVASVLKRLLLLCGHFVEVFSRRLREAGSFACRYIDTGYGALDENGTGQRSWIILVLVLFGKGHGVLVGKVSGIVLAEHDELSGLGIAIDKLHISGFDGAVAGIVLNTFAVGKEVDPIGRAYGDVLDG